MVGIDLSDPGFWDAGLDLVERQLQEAEAAARDAGRVRRYLRPPRGDRRVLGANAGTEGACLACRDGMLAPGYR